MKLLNQVSVPNLDETAHDAVVQNPCLMPKRLFGSDAFDFLINFNPQGYVPLAVLSEVAIPDSNVLQLFLQGANCASLLCQWCLQLRWPDRLDTTYLKDDDWGITWTELYIDFLLSSGQYFPLKMNDSGPYARYIPYNSDEARLAPRAKKSLASQVLNFQRSLRALSSLTNIDWFPRFDSGKCSSLRHLGWDIQACGIPCRPILPCQAQTITAIKQIVRGPAFKQTLSQIVFTPETQPFLHFPSIEELPDEVRYKQYLAFMSRRRQQKRNNS